MKTRMKKVAAILLAGALALSLAACGGSTKEETSSAAASSAEEAESEAEETEEAESESEETEDSESETAESEDAEAESAASEAEEDADAGEGQSYKIGIIQFVDHASLNQIEKNIEEELKKIEEEQGVTFEVIFKNGQANGDTINQIAADMISQKVDLIIPIATPAAQIVQTATEDNQIPVIFSAVSDPVGANLVASMEEPGANITGTSDFLNTEAIMDLILAQNPDIQKVGLLYSNSEDSSVQPIADAKAYLDEKGIAYSEKTGTTVDDISQATDALVADQVEAIFTPTDNTVMTAELAIFEKLIKAGIPHYAGADSFALNGAFLGYSVDYANLGVATADMAAEVLLNGQDTATFAVQTFDNGLATVNTETAEALGYDMDEIKEAFGPYCTDIIETTTAQNFE